MITLQTLVSFDLAEQRLAEKFDPTLPYGTIKVVAEAIVAVVEYRHNVCELVLKGGNTFKILATSPDNVWNFIAEEIKKATAKAKAKERFE